MPTLATLQPAPPDPILGLSEAFKADARPHKINLAVGVYQNEQGQTPTLAAVHAAEQRILATNAPKAYLPITGPTAFNTLTRQLLLGDDHPLNTTDAPRAVSAQTPGGTGGLRVAADFIKQHLADASTTVHLSNPTWPNHPAIFKAAGLPTKTYAYYDPATFGLDFNALLADLQHVKPNDIVVLHGCCHNPTGVDLCTDQWDTVAQLLAERDALPLVDFAYQGFAQGLHEDAAGLRTLLDTCDQALITASYSKNFGLYNQRVGCLTLVAPTPAAATNALSQLKTTIRTNYSNPPAQGSAIVSTILGDPELRTQWEAELATMRDRINHTRRDFAHALTDAGISLSPQGNDFITHQSGMFSFSGLTKTHAQQLRDDHAIYLVNSGRINVAAITPTNLPTLVQAIAAVTA